MNVDEFKTKMKSYNKWKDNITDSEEKLSIIWYLLSGLKSPNLTAIHNSNHDYMESMKLESHEKMEKEIQFHEKRIERARANLTELDEILDLMQHGMKEAVIMLYCQKKTLEQVGRLYN